MFDTASLLTESNVSVTNLRQSIRDFMSDQSSLEGHAAPLTIVYFSMVLLVSILLVSSGQVWWRQMHKRSYDNMTLRYLAYCPALAW
ncbi:hypothetical protein CVIRNUC_004657 [Coccomyxa viridis]|uniref:Uncharacterized protein n=1 Tax=Coccomyxa viridis TaxID=1274662 RepID=A0AAV1I5E3_9CHLO|nr:hypothetical protein CVIRNUC_004657 [Coccomyxa viridis]